MSDETKTADVVEETKDSEATDTASETAPASEAKEEKTEETPKEEVKKEVKEEKMGDLSAQAGIDESVEVPKEFTKLVEQVEKMSVLELNELVKVLEKRFGVSASAVAVAAPGGGDADGAEEQNSFTIELAEAGGTKIQVIKVIKEILGLGLKEAKDMVDAAPTVVKEKVKKEEAEELKTKLEGAGATINLK